MNCGAPSHSQVTGFFLAGQQTCAHCTWPSAITTVGCLLYVYAGTFRSSSLYGTTSYYFLVIHFSLIFLFFCKSLRKSFLKPTHEDSVSYCESHKQPDSMYLSQHDCRPFRNVKTRPGRKQEVASSCCSSSLHECCPSIRSSSSLQDFCKLSLQQLRLSLFSPATRAVTVSGQLLPLEVYSSPRAVPQFPVCFSV